MKIKNFFIETILCPHPLLLNNSQINWTPSNQPIKYLGLNLDTRLNWKNHINIKTQQAKIKLIQLKPILNKNSKLSLTNAITLYETIIRPIMLYACPIWTNAAPSNVNKIQILQNRFLRIITNAPWFISNHQLHSELFINSIIHQIARLSNNFYSNINSIDQLKQYNLASTNNTQTRINNRYPFDSFLKIFSDNCDL